MELLSSQIKSLNSSPTALLPLSQFKGSNSIYVDRGTYTPTEESLTWDDDSCEKHI